MPDFSQRGYRERIFVIPFNMKTTLQVKLLLSSEQHARLHETIHAFNAACTYIVGIAYEQRLALQFELQRRLYYEVHQRFGLSAQLTIRAIGKAALSLEELTGLRDRITVRKGQRNKHASWSFRQLRGFLAYKAQCVGMPCGVR